MLNAWNPDADRQGYGLTLLVSANDRLARIELGSAWAAAGFIGAILLSRALAWARGGDDSADGDSSAEGSGATGKW